MTGLDAFASDGFATDAFGTGALRRRVLDAWAAAPARFREDANAEEELALGGYRDRLVVELAQNAADAARRAGAAGSGAAGSGGSGRLRLTLRDGVLAAANTGAPLDAEGVESLSTLRASSKRDERDAGAVGRFGVGFAAVLAVTDEPTVISVPGGVRWSLAEARALADQAASAASADPALAEELRRRDGHVPLLRLPLPAEGTPPEGYDTVVLLPLRDAAAEDLARRLLDDTDDALLLALPGLAEVVIETDAGVRMLERREGQAEGEASDQATDEVVILDDGAETRWQVVSAGGPLDPSLLADRTVEERHRPHWSLTWAVPVDAGGDPLRVRTAAYLHAPTPSDEPLGLPALLIASFPLDSTRRHVAPGPLTDFLVEQAADAYVELVRRRGASLGSLRLVPAPLGKGELDARLRRAILDRLPETPFLPVAVADSEDGIALRPRDAVLLEGADDGIVRALAAVLPGLLPAGLERRQELRALEVRRVALAETVDQLANLDREPEWWRNLYGALAAADRDALGALPVPLADGRMVRGPRRVLVPVGAPGSEPEVTAEDLAVLGLRLAHPDAAHPLLEKLGAGLATPAGVLESPEVRAAVERSADLDDEDEAEELAEAVLRVVQAAVGDGSVTEEQYPWLARLALPDEDGGLTAAGELVLPGSPLAAIVQEEDALFLDDECAERWGPEVLRAVGVAHSLGLLRAEEAVLDPDDLERFDPTAPADRSLGGEPLALLDEAPDGLAEWAEEVAESFANGDLPMDVPAVPPVAAELLAVRDLDLVDDDAWPQALALLSAPPLRSAVVDKVRLLLPDGGTAEVVPYAAWWLRDHPVLDGRAPAGLRAAGGDRLLRGLYDEARTDLDEVFLHALGVRTTLAALLTEPDGPDDVLERLTDAERPVTHRQLHGIYTALSGVPLERIPLPDEVRALPPLDPDTHRRPAHTVIVDVADAVVVDAPDLVPLLDDFPLITVAPALAPALAERLHVSLASEVAGGRVLSEGTVRRVPAEIRELLPGCPAVYEEHEELLVVGTEGEEAAVAWRWDAGSEAPELPEEERESEEGSDEFAPVVPFGTLHAATPEGLAAGLAWSAGQWVRRFEVLALLGDPDRAYELSAARDFEG
ncbi:sacsin N-terminal ATP-binding-like domain-containing protein [Streptacidiphilus fuscans]|uniref:Molecular chaperone Hsp90 n=1 Tax=Streptacidiphilus fuscans TaxID=2789292 RepID=A0A931B0G8_9ACTN|nr:molecular chaperone Hsp90 [Streptacidiphilus fuscans]MBF9068066.1 molecular chaperone Hsp90 [Streptacidiphilus fuscans]